MSIGDYNVSQTNIFLETSGDQEILEEIQPINFQETFDDGLRTKSQNKTQSEATSSGFCSAASSPMSSTGDPSASPFIRTVGRPKVSQSSRKALLATCTDDKERKRILNNISSAEYRERKRRCQKQAEVDLIKLKAKNKKLKQKHNSCPTKNIFEKHL